MKPLSFMLIAGEASGDTLAAELVNALRERVVRYGSVPTDDVLPLRTELAPRFFGAGGPRMAAAGVELAFDMTRHTVIGITDALRNLLKFRRLFHQLLELAVERQPDVIIGVDYGGFNLRFARAIKRFVRARRRVFNNWEPKLVQFVSPQVWASRAGRAKVLADNHDLLLSIFPFEKEWYGKRVPKLRVEFVGHPMVDSASESEVQSPIPKVPAGAPAIVLLPGSRKCELRRHLPVLLGALTLLRSRHPAFQARMVLPDESLARLAESFALPPGVEIQIGNLAEALRRADLAMASTGTVTVECAHFGVPAVTLYKTSWSNYLIARAIVTVNTATMPNLLANEEVYPEFIQYAATPENLARAAMELLQDETRRRRIKARLAEVVASLRGPGASGRAADAVVSLL
jgi:lipid-A-disaccharide synthase